MSLKNAKEAAESQQREKAAERQRREEEVPVNVAAVNTAGPCARVTSAATSGAPTLGPMPGVIPGETFVHGELYVVFTNSGELFSSQPSSDHLLSLKRPH